jgi:hypothetical protein
MTQFRVEVALEPAAPQQGPEPREHPKPHRPPGVGSRRKRSISETVSTQLSASAVI